MKQKKWRWLLFLILFAAFVYVFSEGLVAGYVICFALLYVLTFFLLVRYSARKVTVSLREYQQEAGTGNCQVDILVENKGKLPVFCCGVQVTAQNLITGRQEQCQYEICLSPGKTKTISVDVKDTLCGGILFQVDSLVIGDYTKLIIKRSLVNAETYAYVLPGLQQLQVSKEDLGRYDMESHKFSPYKKGNDSSETFGIREYQPGDSMKNMHWKLSGKMDSMVVREPGLPIETKLLLLVDKTSAGAAFDGECNSKATELAIDLSYTFVSSHIPHAFGWYNSRKAQFECYKITNEEELWSAIPALLTAPYQEEADTVDERFIEAEIEKEFSRIVLVANQEIQTERLMEYGEVDLYTPKDFRLS